MHPVIYDVAVSLDGFIAGPSGDISRFAHEGEMVDDYRHRLSGYAVAIMGRATYEFAYAHGMAPGANPYPHMRTVVFSRSIDLPGDARVEVVGGDMEGALGRIRSDAGGPVYLCGGGRFAHAVARAGLLDRLRIKRTPVVVGAGTPLFDPPLDHLRTQCLETRVYPGGQVFQDLAVLAGEA